MKKIIFIVSALVVAFSLCFTAYAEDAEVTTDAEVETVETVEKTPEESVAEDIVADIEGILESEEEPHTIYSRLWEYVVENKATLLGAAGDVGLLVLALLLKKRVASVKGDTSVTGESQKSVVNAVNDMIDGYNSLKESYDKYGLTEDDRNRVVGALVAQNTAILEILTTITVNNKNTPQGVKDITMLAYANCLKALEDDEKLKAIVTSVRDSIGAKTETEEESNTEV